MTLSRSAYDGKLYGTSMVILTRDTGAVGDIEQHIGYTAPFGGILVNRFDDRSYVEEPWSWWEAQGFVITEPSVLLKARALGRTSSDKRPEGGA